MEDLASLWRSALADVRIRHPNRESRVNVTVDDQPGGPVLLLSLDKTTDSRDPSVTISPFMISCVRLTYFPGVDLARKWLAAAFAGYVQHEALELVTVGDLVTRPLDPHEPPFTYDKGLRQGLPTVLTPASLAASLAVVMPVDAVEALLA